MAILVPLVPFIVPKIPVDSTSSPGAITSRSSPTDVKSEISPSAFCEPTEITSGYAAGYCTPVVLSLPAAATRTIPAS